MTVVKKMNLSPHHSLGQVVIDKVLPGDLTSTIPEEEIIGDGCPERRSCQDKHPELSIVPGNVTLKPHNLTSALYPMGHSLFLHPH